MHFGVPMDRSRRCFFVLRRTFLFIPSRLRLSLLLGCGFAGCLTLFGTMWYGSFDAMLARLNGYPLLVDAAVRSLGDLSADVPSTVSFRVTNITGDRLTISGAHTTCGCMAATNLPLTLAAGEAADVEFTVFARKANIGQKYEQSAVFYVDHPGPRVRVEIRAHVVSQPTGDSSEQS